jgi:hypothetical protein
MSIKLTDTQLVLLGAAAQRKDLCLVAPPTLKGATAQKVASKLISAGFVKEVKAKASDPIWRRDEESGASYALKLTAAGAKAIAVDDPAEPEDAGGESDALANRDQAAILINMLPSAAKGNEMAIERILEIARMAAPRIRISRGPKVTVASAAHELFLEKHGIRGASAYSYSDLEEGFIDDATRATRLEFPGEPFGPQPASRRLKGRRQLAGVPCPRRGAKGGS